MVTCCFDIVIEWHNNILIWRVTKMNKLLFLLLTGMLAFTTMLCPGKQADTEGVEEGETTEEPDAPAEDAAE